MSNLGHYQVFTTGAKKVGGPLKLLVIAGGVGALTIGVPLGGLVTKGCEKVGEFARKKRLEKEVIGTIYSAKIDGTDKQGLRFKKGDKFKVLSADGNAILIEKINDENNPYFVSADFLSSISNFKL